MNSNYLSELDYWLAIKRANDEGLGGLAECLVKLYLRDYPKR